MFSVPLESFCYNVIIMPSTIVHNCAKIGVDMCFQKIKIEGEMDSIHQR